MTSRKPVILTVLLCSPFLTFLPRSEAATESVLYSFCGQQNCVDGAGPQSNLIYINGVLYGTTDSGGTGNCSNDTGCGTVFSYDLKTGLETVLYSFQNNTVDGIFPNFGLTNVKGTLYGTTYLGGSTGCVFNEGCGTIFSVDPNSGLETILHSFQDNGTDGYLPRSGLTYLSGSLYGTTMSGGNSDCFGAGCGTVFAFDISTTSESVAHAFRNDGSDGYDPEGGLTTVAGQLFGSTLSGTEFREKGDFVHEGHGTVFSLNPSDGSESVVYKFRKNSHKYDSFGANGNLTEVNGLLYGTALNGSEKPGMGAVYSIDPDSGNGSVVYSFESYNCTRGAYPYGGMVKFGNKLYGTTSVGGANGGCEGMAGGTVFWVNPSNGIGGLAYSFCSQKNCADGATPVGGLIAVNGKLYGTTVAGGTINSICEYGCGTIFVVTP